MWELGGGYNQNSGSNQRLFFQFVQSIESRGGISDREHVQQVTKEQNERLLASVTPEEVKEVAFSMHPEKSPGPDRLPDRLKPTFFKNYWSVLRFDVVRLCKKFLKHENFPLG